MILYHYSNAKVKKLSINHFAENSFSLNDKKALNVKRLFFYTRIEDRENLLNGCKYLYSVKINDNKIYNLIEDKKNYKQRFNSIDKLVKAIIKAGYAGIVYNVGFNVVNIFKNVSVIKTEKLF